MSSTTNRRMYAYKSDDTSNVLGAAYKAGSDAKHVTKAAAKSDKVVGFCQQDAGQVLAVEDPIELAIKFGGAKALANGVITESQELTFDGTGLVAAAAGDWVSAQANEPGVAGQIISVEVCGYFKAA